MKYSNKDCAMLLRNLISHLEAELKQKKESAVFGKDYIKALNVAIFLLENNKTSNRKFLKN